MGTFNGLQVTHLFPAFLLALDMWIFSVGDSRGKIGKHHKEVDAPPAITQQTQF